MAIVKRSGELEPYSEIKMKKFLSWAVGETKMSVDVLYNELTIPTKDVPVDTLLKDIEATAERLASRIATGWLYVAGRVATVALVKRHRANGLDLINPHRLDLLEFLETQLFTFTASDVRHNKTGPIASIWKDILAAAMDLEYDYSLTINNVRLLTQRQARKYKGVNETPSLVMLRQAVAGSEYPKGNYDPEHALVLLKALKARQFTNATPMAIHAGKQYRSTGSCTLLTTEDSTKGIMDVASELAQHSKFGSGNGIDVSAIAGEGRYIASTEGKSSGVKPFLKIYESVLQGFNQAGKRQGAGVVTFRWWHKDFEELIYLKNTTGENDQRVRGLKYSMVTNRYLYEAAQNNQEVALICPSDAHAYFGDNRLLTAWGDYFEEVYTEILNQVKQGNVPGRIVTAKWVFKLYFNNAYNSGHVYEFNMDNANYQNMLDDDVHSSNLCTEVMIPSWRTPEPSTGLCFLNSTNIAEYYSMGAKERYELIKAQVRTLDNQITTDHYPVPHTSKQYAMDNRFIGIGMSNLATLFAEQNISWDSQEALNLMDQVTEDWSFDVIMASMVLAEERGPAPNWKSSKWAEGLLPSDLATQAAWELTGSYPTDSRWNWLADQIRIHGIRNLLTMAIAPTASSGAGAGLCEGIDPVTELVFNRSGDVPVTHAVNMSPKILNQYEQAFSVPNTALIKLAAVRQKWIDQGQAVSLYAKGQEFSLRKAFEERLLAHSLGLKSIYYTKFQKAGADICQSCS